MPGITAEVKSRMDGLIDQQELTDMWGLVMDMTSALHGDGFTSSEISCYLMNVVEDTVFQTVEGRPRLSLTEEKERFTAQVEKAMQLQRDQDACTKEPK